MKRLSVAVLVVVAFAFALPTPGHASQVGACTWKWTRVSVSDLTLDNVITAGPLDGGEPATPYTAVTCEIRVNDPDDARGQRITQATPGPVGVLTWLAYLVPGSLTPGDEVWLCTYTYTTLTRTSVDHGCSYAFTY